MESYEGTLRRIALLLREQGMEIDAETLERIADWVREAEAREPAPSGERGHGSSHD